MNQKPDDWYTRMWGAIMYFLCCCIVIAVVLWYLWFLVTGGNS